MVWTDVAICYMILAYFLLDVNKTLEVHADVIFLPHIIIILICLAGLLLPGRPRKGKEQ